LAKERDEFIQTIKKWSLLVIPNDK
jgi:hypothetical protein